MQWIDEDLINKIILIDGGLNIEQKRAFAIITVINMIFWNLQLLTV